MTLPDFDALRPAPTGHPSDLAIDRLLAGSLAPDAAAEIETHCAGCAECGARLERHRLGFSALAGVDPRPMLSGIEARLEQRGPFAALVAWFTGARALIPLAVAGAVAFFVLRQPPPIPDLADAGGTRLKGALALRVHKATADGSVELIDGAAVSAGDRLRFMVDLPFGGRVRVVGVEAGGTLFTAWPLPQHTASDRVAAGIGIALPGAVAVDATPGTETFHVVLCPAEVAPECAPRSGGLACPPGCTTRAFAVVKR